MRAAVLVGPEDESRLALRGPRVDGDDPVHTLVGLLPVAQNLEQILPEVAVVLFGKHQHLAGIV
jgi:hypothetical protein